MRFPGSVDRERYPLDNADARRELILKKRRELADGGYATFQGFIMPDAVARMAAEATALRPHAFRRDQELRTYLKPADPSLSDRHPVNRRHPYAMQVLAMDMLPSDSEILSIYAWDGLTELIRNVLAESALHRVADPLVACAVTYMGPGDQHGWHFDDNDFVVSLLIQKPVAGGAFEFAPNICRKGIEDDYGRIAAVMDGTSSELRRLSMPPGTLVLFRGRRTLHRVSPVVGDRPRIITLLSYHPEPGFIFDDRVKQNAVGRMRPQRHHERHLSGG